VQSGQEYKVKTYPDGLSNLVDKILENKILSAFFNLYRPCRNIFEEKCSYQNGNFS
jgi:hypothetical protein